MDDGGKWGKVHQGTCIKYTWTKPRWVCLRVGGRHGWGGGQRWGENEDNYT